MPQQSPMDLEENLLMNLSQKISFNGFDRDMMLTGENSGHKCK